MDVFQVANYKEYLFDTAKTILVLTAQAVTTMQL